jgi:hypothetical protein
MRWKALAGSAVVRGFGRSPSRLSSPRPIAAPTDEEIAAGATAPPGFIHLPRGVRPCATSKSKGCRWSSSAKAFSAWGRPLRNSCALIGRELSWQRRIPPFRSRPTPLLEPKVVVNQRCRCGEIPTINGLSSLHKHFLGRCISHAQVRDARPRASSQPLTLSAKAEVHASLSAIGKSSTVPSIAIIGR